MNNNHQKNIDGSKLEPCGEGTGFYRDNYCHTGQSDLGSHTVCAITDKGFLDFTKNRGNDLSSVVQEGSPWCLCQSRWMEAYQNRKDPKVNTKATHSSTRKEIQDSIRKSLTTGRKQMTSRKKRNGKITNKRIGKIISKRMGISRKRNIRRGGGGKKKPVFLYHPDNPDKSFDVYIDKDPSDTIPIKYTTLNDVTQTIKKLERHYKKGEYPHKRIWQVAMIMKVRLDVILKRHPRVPAIISRQKLAARYFHFLKKRTGVKGERDRKKLVFSI